MALWMHLHNVTSLLCFPTLLCIHVCCALLSTNCLDVTSLWKGWQAATGPRVWPCAPGTTLQQYYSSCALCICTEPRRGHGLGSLGRGDHLVLPQQEPWWCEDTQMHIKAMLRGITLGTLLKEHEGPLAQWFKNKPLESRILAMLQVPFPSTSE